jgi:outer membrane protein OmpA-like peptidoglycan-associated protein
LHSLRASASPPSGGGGAFFPSKGWGAFLLLIFILSIHPVSAQKFSLSPKVKADKLYETKQYYAAIQGFEKELSEGKGDQPATVWKKIGLCYLKINQPQKAIYWLQQVTATGSADADAWYQYGLALQQIADYHKAMAAFEQCLQMQPGHPTVSVKIESCHFAMTHYRVNPYANFRPSVELNTTGGEFGVSLYAGGRVYYSSAAPPVEGAKIDQRTGLQHVEIYMARLQNKRIRYPQIADQTLPKFVTDGLFAYDSLTHSVYFAWCDPNNSRCGIYSSKLALGKWTAPSVVVQNKKDQVSGHPAIANGGNRLYFTSNSSEGNGQTDIWYVDKTKDGKWGQPVNAGTTVNTPGREEFPFIHADTLLFFASDGHVGYGGLDIFCSVIRDHTFSTPVNLRRPFNSQGDDFGLTISGGTGILSSSRNESVSDDIFLFDGVPAYLYLGGHVTDLITGDILKNARLTLSLDGKVAQQTVSDSTGYYGFFLFLYFTPIMYARTTGYKPSLTDVQPPDAEQFTDFRHDIRLQQSVILPATIQLYHKITGTLIAERGIVCFNNDGEEQILRTDASGSFKLIAQEDQREYWVKFPDGAYLTESIILNDEQKSYTLAVQPIGGELFAGWLRFKRGSVEATEMSQALIPRIAAVIKANQGMVFQLEGFCDRGFEVNQTTLAIQRAEYILRRLVDEGVDPRQLNAAAGSRTTNTGEDDADQRRVEIKIRR